MIRRPTGKEKLLQPTLSSFLSLKSGLKGSGGKRAREPSPSSEPSQQVTGKGPQAGPTTGNLQMFGEGEGRPRVVLKGSPEHNLLHEAKVLVIGESYSQGQDREGRGSSGSNARKLVRWPPDRRNREKTKEGNEKMVGPSSVGENSTSRAKENSGREPRTRLFPRE